jgi:hypothetical protein
LPPFRNFHGVLPADPIELHVQSVPAKSGRNGNVPSGAVRAQHTKTHADSTDPWRVFFLRHRVSTKRSRAVQPAVVSARREAPPSSRKTPVVRSYFASDAEPRGQAGRVRCRERTGQRFGQVGRWAE